MNLFEDAVFVAVLDRREVRSNKSFTLLDHIEGCPEEPVILVVEDDVVVGNIRAADSYYQVRYGGAGLHVIRQIDESRPPDGEPIPVYIPGRETTQDFGIAAADDGSTFDVMVVYTPVARAAAGGLTAMNALINLAVVETNTAYLRSGVLPPSQTGPSGGSQLFGVDRPGERLPGRPQSSHQSLRWFHG